MAEKPRLFSVYHPRATTGFAAAGVQVTATDPRKSSVAGKAVAHSSGNWHSCHRSFIALRGVAQQRSFDLYAAPGKPVPPQPFEPASGGSPGAAAAGGSSQSVAGALSSFHVAAFQKTRPYLHLMQSRNR